MEYKEWAEKSADLWRERAENYPDKNCMSRLWKQVAKKYWLLYNKKWWVLHDAQATADRRGRLLKRSERKLVGIVSSFLYDDAELKKLLVDIAEELAQQQADEYLEAEGAHHKLEDFDDAET